MRFEFKALVFAVLTAMLALNAWGLEPSFDIASVNYDPAPVVPGEYFSLYVHVRNNSDVEAKNSVFNLRLSADNYSVAYPFSLADGDSALRQLGDVKARQTVTLQYKVLVDRKALDGTYTLYLEAGDNGKVKTGSPFNVRVVNRRPVVKIVSATPTTAVIGETAGLQLTLKNIGSSMAKSVSIALSEDRTVTTSGVVVERSLVPLGASVAQLESLDVGETANVSAQVVVNPGTLPKAYYLPLKLEYFDSNKTQYSSTESIGLKVSGKIELGASAENGALFYPGSSSELTVDVYNRGNEDAKYLLVKAAADFMQLEQEEFFIGSLEPDDFDSITIKGRVSANAAPGEHLVRLVFSFKDSFENPGEVARELPVVVRSIEEVEQNGNNYQPALYAVAGLLALAVLWRVFGGGKGKK